MPRPTLEELWAEARFQPNDNQRRAILHADGPLFLTAGPGSGKTRVLLWRALNLIVFQDVPPEEIFLSTFTEKAALQLKTGIQSLLGAVSNHTGKSYDLSKMYIGTVHSLCQKLIIDRRFSLNRTRAAQPSIMDELDQYFYFRTAKKFRLLMDVAGFNDAGAVNAFFGAPTQSVHVATTNCISLFNRFSEENLDPDHIKAKTSDDDLQKLIEMYAYYKSSLVIKNQVDFSLLQQRAYESLVQSPNAEAVFKHIIIDEYQDTNTIQEKIFFKLAGGHKNICVVGDDDQALYRFRASRVENFVQFPERCETYLTTKPTNIPLDTNYRSRQTIVSFYKDFIDQCNWARDDGKGHYRVVAKNITAHSDDQAAAVVATSNADTATVCNEIVGLVRYLLAAGKVQDPNQIAFLFPSLQYQGTINANVLRLKQGLENAGLKVYAPRAGRFLDVEESVAVFGILLMVFGKPKPSTFASQNLDRFDRWMDLCQQKGQEILRTDKELKKYVALKREEIATSISDYHSLLTVAQAKDWEPTGPYEIETMKRALYEAKGLSQKAKKAIGNQYFERVIKERRQTRKPVTLGYVINAATSLDWNVLDLFYRITGFSYFKSWFDLAEAGKDEGPICNLGLLSQYLSDFLEKYSSLLTARYLDGGFFHGQFFQQYLYALFLRGESEYEDANDPFPKGRIPFLTIHQSKGLEFPVVVLGSVNKKDNGLPFVEEVVRPLLDIEGEPADRSSEFDIMRMFYVALSRAENLLVIANPRGRGISTYRAFRPLLDNGFPRIPSFKFENLPSAKHKDSEIPQTYSYTSDYLLFQKCPRQYMFFRKYGFVASRSQMQFFGSLVHETIEDLHQLLIAKKASKEASQ